MKHEQFAKPREDEDSRLHNGHVEFQISCGYGYENVHVNFRDHDAANEMRLETELCKEASVTACAILIPRNVVEGCGEKYCTLDFKGRKNK